ncbi:Flp family type IVb pilin [Devosia nitrariae]|uniref:Pilus assembly protein n=1 Tax=Devosia nitrariae TaxID=2071872 RepID=A0ABQ5VZW3_9HYPH|nr:Flp family type IVb pilin [Devosia nitrariae]GLQ53262.1 pilus assembly protein [Devosia nitrariae]
MATRLRHFLSEDTGATAIEYGLLAALLAIMVVASIALLGEPVGGLFSSVATEFDTANEKF